MPESLGFQLVPPARPVRFGPFELDSRAGELRKHGIRIRLKQQAFQVLLMLLKHPGDVVLREEIREKLWPLDTVVEFDHSINAAIQKLRDALGESAASPHYIETLPRRGYRFIGTVENAPSAPVSQPAPASTPETGEPTATPAEQPRRQRAWAPQILTAAGLLLGVLALAMWISPGPARAPVDNWTLSLGAIRRAQVSPDGTAVIYPVSHGLALRRMDSLQETPVYTEDSLYDSPAWSNDGSQMLILTLQGLIRVPLNGPPAMIWPQIGVTRGFTWGPDGTVLAAVFGKSDGGNLFLVPASGGTPTRLEVPGFTHGWFFHPEFLPDGKNFLFAWAASGDKEAGLYLAALERGRITRGPILLRKNMTAGRYSPSGGGRLLYVQNDSLYAQNLNIRRGALEGEPNRVVDGVFSEVMQRRADFSVSRNGVLVWRAGRAGLAQLTWFDRAGTVLGTAGPLCLPDLVRLSSDEKHVLMDTAADGMSIVEPNKSGYTSLSGLTKAPLWMPDSSRILYGRMEGNALRLVERAAEGGTEKKVALVPELNTLHDVSADGKVLLYKVRQTLYSVRLDSPPGDAKPLMVVQTVQGRFSPDGRWVVYSKIRSNGTEVYVQPFPSGGLPTQLTTAGGDSPIWRGDGKEILYRNGATIYGLRVEVKGNTIKASRPEALFKIRVPAGLVAESVPMAVTRDGSRILFAQGVEQPDPQLTYVMTAWDKALHR